MSFDELKKQYDSYLPSYYRYDTTLAIKLEVFCNNLEHDIKENIDKGFSATTAAIVATSSALRMANMNYAFAEAALNSVGKNFSFEKTNAEILHEASFRCLATILGFKIPEREDGSNASFPANVLPAPLRDYVIAVADAIQVPLEMAGPIALGVLSTAALKKFAVREYNGHLNPLCLYIAVCAESGERKSSTLAAFTDILFDFEDHFNQVNSEQIDKTLRAERRVKLYDELSVKNEEYEDKYKAAKEAFDVMDKLYPMRIAVDDVTPEALTRLLAVNGEHAAIISAEGGVLDVLAGRYSKAINIDVLLHGNNTERHTVDRVSRPTDKLKSPEVSIVLAVQPDVIRRLVSNGDFATRGFLGRFLYAMCKSRVGSRSYIAPEIPAAAKEAYDEVILRLLKLPFPKSPTILTISNNGNDYLSEYYEYNEGKLVCNPNRVVDGSVKHVGTIIRIAGLIHIVSDPTAEKPISDDELSQATELAEFFRRSADAVFTGSEGSLADPDKAYLLEVIRRREFAVCEKTKLFSQTRSRFKKAEQLDVVLTKLEKEGYVRLEKNCPPTGRPSITVIANPMLFYDD